MSAGGRTPPFPHPAIPAGTVQVSPPTATRPAMDPLAVLHELDNIEYQFAMLWNQNQILRQWYINLTVMLGMTDQEFRSAAASLQALRDQVQQFVPRRSARGLAAPH